MQVCTLLQTDNHVSTPPLCFLQAGCPSCRPTNRVKALKAHTAPDKFHHYYYYAAFNAPCVGHKDDESQANHGFYYTYQMSQMHSRNGQWHHTKVDDQCDKLAVASIVMVD